MPGQLFSPLRLRWVKGIFMFRCNLSPSLLAEWPGSFTCHCGNTRVEQAPNKSQHTKLTLEKKMLQPLLPGFELATFQSRVRRSNQQAIPALVEQVGTVSVLPAGALYAERHQNAELICFLGMTKN